jgi:hypothetical protein
LVHLYLRISTRIFEKKLETVLTGYSGAGGKLIHEKTRSKKSHDTVPLRLFLGRVVQHFVESCEFAIGGLNIKNLLICDLRTGTPQKFAALRLQNEPKNLWICDLRTFLKSLLAHLCKQQGIRKSVCGQPVDAYGLPFSDMSTGSKLSVNCLHTDVKNICKLQLPGNFCSTLRVADCM